MFNAPRRIALPFVRFRVAIPAGLVLALLATVGLLAFARSTSAVASDQITMSSAADGGSVAVGSTFTVTLAVTASSTAAVGVPAAAARAKSMRRNSMALQPTSRAMRNTSESGVVSSVQV